MNKTNVFTAFAKKPLLIVIYIAIIIIGGFLPELHAESILEGTPKTQGDVTVFTASVEENQTYSSVFGVKSGNTDYSSHGEVIINKGIVTGTVYGARAISVGSYTHSNNNNVNISYSTIGTVYGAYAYGGSGNTSVQNNEVKINGGNISSYVYGGYADGSTISIAGNKVTISGAQIGKSVYGGCAFNTDSWLSMIRNEVIIENSTVNTSVYGGYASGSNTASNNNTVTIKTGSLIKGAVYGGYALSSNSDAKNNTVIIEGGTVNGHIYGGIGRNAVNNSVVLKGGNLNNADLFGYSDGRKTHYGNTLEIWTAETEVKSARNFENYYFLIPAGIVNQAEKYMLKVNTPVNLTDTEIGIAVQNGNVLNVNDKVNLINNIEGTPDLVSLEGKTLKGGTSLTRYDFSISSENNTLIATVLSSGSPLLLQSPPQEFAGKTYAQAKSLAEGQVASVSLLGNVIELAMSSEFSKAEDKNWATFLTFDYGKTDYRTDAHISLYNTDMIAGISKSLSYSDTENFLGIFLESGNGNYSTFNSFEDGSVNGNGNAQYNGGGLMLQLESPSKEKLYLQALGRIGNINNCWTTDDFFQERISYDTNQLYYGAAAGVGCQNEVHNRIIYDMFGKFMWTHQNGDNADINGENVQFRNIDSLKTVIGLNIDYVGSRAIKPFLGVAWEKEFNAVARSEVNELKIDDADLKGNSGRIEVGITCKPEETNWQFNLSATGYFGVRRELSGTALLILNF